jgi:uncharacterized protein (TIGR03067 family)
MAPSLLIILSVSVGAPSIKEPPKQSPTIVGEWVVEKALVGGKDNVIATKGDAVKVTFSFTKEGQVLVTEGSKKPEPADYAVDPKKSPAIIDVSPPPGKVVTGAAYMRGVYVIDGDTLTICISRGGTRPTKFESPDGSDLMLMTMKRVKK